MNRLKGFAEHYYNRSEIYQSSPTIVLELNHIKFELVPAYVSYGMYYIPKDSANWQYTNPDGFHSDLQECNKNNGYKIKPVIRLIKHWNIEKNYRDMASFALEQKIAEELKYSYISCTSYTDYLKKAFTAIKYSTNYSRVDTAIGHIDKALELEADSMPYTALRNKKAFPGCDMSRRDDVSHYYNPSQLIDKIATFLFYANVVLACISIGLSGQVKHYAIVGQVLIAISYVLLTTVDDFFFWYTAESFRRKNAIEVLMPLTCRGL